VLDLPQEGRWHALRTAQSDGSGRGRPSRCSTSRTQAATQFEAVVVFDYAEPFQNYPAERRASVTAVAESAAARGEPWLTLFDPADLHELLRGAGFKTEDLGLPEIAERLYGELRRGITIGPGPHIVRAYQ